MATTAYTIYSDYDPQQRRQLEIETGQIVEEIETDQAVESLEDTADNWEIEATAAFKRKLAPPPRFVPATSRSDEWDTPGASSSKSTLASTGSNDISGWYRSMTSKAAISTTNTPAPKPVTSLPGPSSATNEPAKHQKYTKNDWFIQNVLKNEDSTTPTTTSSTSLADILSRDPPPLPSENKFQPPVWLAIGPSNKGFAMLQNSGWNEGEPLGADVVRRRRLSNVDSVKKSRGISEPDNVPVKQETVELDVGDGEIKEIRSVIDLTASDSDDSADDEPSQTWSTLEGLSSESFASSYGTPSYTGLADDSGRKALITPIATVLKSDRLGIGLKAKTVGPYKSSMKRVTHGATALAAHLERAEEARQRRKLWGRGRKGFIRRDKQEQEQRRNMLAYMNT